MTVAVDLRAATVFSIGDCDSVNHSGRVTGIF